MPAPTATAIYNAITSNLPSEPRFDGDRFYFPIPYTINFTNFLNGFSSGLSAGWATWQAGILGGDNVVSGTGLGTWTGTGSGGKLVASDPLTFTINMTPQSSQFPKFSNAIIDTLPLRFATWILAWAFTSVTYTGTSTATGASSGTFSATGALPPASLSSIGTGPALGTIRSAVEGILSGDGWNISESALDTLLTAIDTGVGDVFNTWLSSTTFSGDSVSGSAAAGTGAGSGTSEGNGILT